MTSVSLQVEGIDKAIRSLNKLEPGLRKQFNQEARTIAAPAVNAVRDGYKYIALSGMSRTWQGPAVKGRKVFPMTIAKARKGVDVTFNTDRKSTGVINIIQRDAGTAIFETAGRKQKNPLGNSLGTIQPGRTRLLGPIVYSRRAEIEKVMYQMALRIFNKIDRELKK